MELPAVDENRNEAKKNHVSTLTASIIVLTFIFIIVIIVWLGLRIRRQEEVTIEKNKVQEQVGKVSTPTPLPVYTKTSDPSEVTFGYSEPCGMSRHSYGPESRRLALRVETEPTVDSNGDLNIKLGYEYKGKIYSYPVIFGGLPIGGEDPSKTFPSIYSIYDEAGGLLKGSQLLDHLSKRDMVLVCLPTDINDAPPSGWEFWSVWFEPQKEKLLKYRDGMQSLVKSSLTDGEPPDPSETTLYITEIVILRKLDIPGIGIE